NSVPPTLAQAGAEESASGTSLTTISPTLVSGSSSVILLGSVLSHETANIYPRRDGIIEDVYVDIGDTVKKNQVVALLLPKGVEGQSAAMIAEKQARKFQAESDLSTSEQVAEETIINTRQKINEKETELMIAKREQEALIQKFAESEANIAQMREQAFTSVQNARQLIEWITLGSNTRSGIDMRDDDVLRNLGIHDSSNASRYDIVYRFNSLYAAEQEYVGASSTQKPAVIDRLLPLALDALSTTNTLLQYTPTQPSANGIDQLSHAQLTDRLGKVVSAQDMIYKAKEKLEDARLSFQTLTSGEPELYRAYRSGNHEGANSNKVRMLQEQIRTSHNSLALTEANQEQMVEMKRKQVDIAAAMLQSEYATSGNRKILSPFSGTVSKRFIDVGQIVMPSMSAFELTGVPTSLAKKAKTEIQFGLPEQLIGALDIGDTVTFFLQSEETTPYSAEVTRKSPQVDMQTHTITVQAKVPDDLSLPHGSSVRVRLIDEKKPIFRVPSSAVKREAEGNYVWVMDAETEKPMQSTVSVIAEDGEFAEVTGMITAESLLILDPPSRFTTNEEHSNPMP
ncbi:MAG: efflux RND transporter periplasmic adaptor subunit, partial [Candidatus Peregrinibacteria bacterium]|nr:efflux RND transporter periplasmic adaptor subunit [Candidatus Peregrinibacteria bacterium]